MKHVKFWKLLPFGIAFIVFLLTGCNFMYGPDEPKTSDNAPVGTAKVLMRTSAGGPFASIAESASVIISATDITTIVRQLTVTDTSVEGTITDIPAGKARLFTISVFDSAGTLQYTGQGYANVIADSSVMLSITVTRVRGTVFVNGHIIEGTLNLNANGVYGKLGLTFQPPNVYATGQLFLEGISGNEIFQISSQDSKFDSTQRWNGRSCPEFSFGVTNKEQRWYGWEDWCRKYTAGYIVDSSTENRVEYPWVAFNDSSFSPLELSSVDLPIYGTYAFNQNGYTGIVVISLVNGSLNGVVDLSYDGLQNRPATYHWTFTNSTINSTQSWNGRILSKITFNRSDGEQTYYGWQSWDRRLIAGYMNDHGSVSANSPWYAVRIQ